MAAVTRLAGVLALLTGCAPDPITNAVFYEDEAFLAALPSEEDLAVPDGLSEPPSGSSAVLASAASAADALDDVWAPFVAAAETLRAETPDRRSDTERGWDGVLVATTTDEGVDSWVIDCTIVRPDDGGPVTWEMTRAESSGDERIAWASGEEGAFRLLLDGGEALEVTWTPAAAGHPEDRRVDAEVVGATGLPTDRAWGLYGAQGLAWSGRFAITEDGASWPGWAVAAHLDTGGRATGEVWRDAETLAFETCWDAEGNDVWMSGDDDVPEIGASSACTVPDLPDSGR
jgi:hypothetical protein